MSVASMVELLFDATSRIVLTPSLLSLCGPIAAGRLREREKQIREQRQNPTRLHWQTAAEFKSAARKHIEHLVIASAEMLFDPRTDRGAARGFCAD